MIAGIIFGGDNLNPLLIYLSGPYSADTEAQILFNVNRANAYGVALMRKGHHVIIPHLSHYTEQEAAAQNQGGFSWERWMEQDLAILELCDALFFIDHSPGADIELARAKELGLQIFYSLDEVKAVE